MRQKSEFRKEATKIQARENNEWLHDMLKAAGLAPEIIPMSQADASVCCDAADTTVKINGCYADYDRWGFVVTSFEGDLCLDQASGESTLDYFLKGPKFTPEEIEMADRGYSSLPGAAEDERMTMKLRPPMLDPQDDADYCEHGKLFCPICDKELYEGKAV